MIDLSGLTAGTELDVRADVAGPTLAVAFTGSAEMGVFDALKVIVARLHAAALAAKVTEVAIDFTKLEFMSSSCFKCLVTWIGDITDLEEARQYKLRFHSSSVHLWQRRSLHVLQTFATELVFVESS